MAREPRKRTRKKKRSKGGCLKRLTVGCGLLLLVLLCAGGMTGLVGAGLSGVAYQKHVVQNPGDHLKRDNIMSAISQESAVYFRDGHTRVGVFFSDQHRVFVKDDAIPTAYVMGIIAAEDAGYWSHWGVSPLAIVRAMFLNIKAGTLVSGGSTLSQQTAKNIFNRPDRSLKSKLTEFVNTLRLEAHFSKQEILTFYINQFYVAGNGRGLGIAARYFFGKEEPRQLTVLEAAYIAGLVKGPSNYDPFLGDEARRKRATEKAHTRTKYVLRRLTEVPTAQLAGPYPHEDVRKIQMEAQRLLDEGFTIPFQRGTFRYDSNATLEEVAKRLKEPPLLDVLEKAGYADPQTAGLEVITTLDADAQREAMYALTHHLTVVGTMLERVPTKAYLLDKKLAPRHNPHQVVKVHDLKTAVIRSRKKTRTGVRMTLDLGGLSCVADEAAVSRIATAVYRGKRKSRHAKPTRRYKAEVVDEWGNGEVMLVSIRAMEKGKEILCDLEYRPTLQGAVAVVEDGQLRAMVGGTDNQNYNRATAPRQMGSTWKPLLFHAAMELGWLPTDTLDNRPNVFPYGSTPYYPSADHKPSPEVSMSWAGVRSENLASVWLLYHLTDHLTEKETSQLAEALDLARRPIESAAAYRTRIRKLGVLPTRRRLREVHFLGVRDHMLTEVDTWAYPEDEVSLRSLLYGWGTESFRSQLKGGDTHKNRLKNQALDHSYGVQSERLAQCREQYNALAVAVSEGRMPALETLSLLSVEVGEERARIACGLPPQATYVPLTEANVRPLLATRTESSQWEQEEAVETEAAPARSWKGIEMVDGGTVRGRRSRRRGGQTQPNRTPPPPRPRAEPPSGRPTGAEIPMWRSEPEVESGSGLPLAPFESVIVDARLHVATLQALELRMAETEPPAATDLYASNILYQFQDFRLLLGMRYLAEIAHQYGVKTKLPIVLPLPLGAAEITIEEASSIYDGITTGQAWDFPGEDGKGQPVRSPEHSTLLIQEVRDASGQVLYRAKPKGREVGRAESGEMTSDILGNVVRHGTGRYARGRIRAGRYKVPVGGKTGTTNAFRNAAFMGFVPKAEKKGFHVGSGYAVGVYVGYDDNRSMKTGGIVLAGASGALPTWTWTASGLGDVGLLGSPASRSASKMKQHSATLKTVGAASGTGLVGQGGPGAILTWKGDAPPLRIPWRKHGWFRRRVSDKATDP